MDDKNDIGGTHPIAEKAVEFADKEILVGGYALAFLAKYYGVEPCVTKDIDFLGTVDDADVMAKKLGGTLHIGSWDEKTPLAAHLTVPEGGFVSQFINQALGLGYRVDYLHSLYGMDVNEVAENAVLIDYGGKALRVIHPLQCLETRVINLAELENKQTENSMKQAETAVKTVRAFIKTLNPDENAQVLEDMAEIIAELAHDEQGKIVYRDWGVDILQAIPLEYMPAKFRQESWARSSRKIQVARRMF